MNQSILNGIVFLRNNDYVIKELIDKNGDCTLKLSKDYFPDLVRSIVSQQLSTKAASSIFQKLKEKLQLIEPELVLSTSIEALKSAGLSNQKSRYIKELAIYFQTNQELIGGFTNMSDDDIVRELCKVKGIGTWTAQMFLIFSLNRLNVLPIDDVGFRRSVIINYKLDLTADIEKEIIKISKKWGNYCSISAWYLWKQLDS